METAEPSKKISDIWETDDDLKEDDDTDGFPWTWLRWCPTSKHALRKSEEELLACVKTPISFGYVNIGNVDTIPGEPIKIWTAALNKDCPGIPIVLVHGFASGLALWCLNYDGLAEFGRPVFSFDMPGFGQSSRPEFSSDPEEVEKQFVMCLEGWRDKMRLNKMILVGHSMGAFIVFSYAIHYPDRVAHMMLADPWGINEKPGSLSELSHVTTTHRYIIRFLDSLPLNPLWTVRLLGPMGVELIKRVRLDLISNFIHVVDDAPSKVANYIFHCNVQKPTTGESAYHCMMVTFGWAKHPLCRRLNLLHPSVPMTLAYGSRSWMDHYPAEKLRAIRSSSYVGFHVLVAGHHVYADSHEAFNAVVLEVCQEVEKMELTSESSPSFSVSSTFIRAEDTESLNTEEPSSSSTN